MRRLAKRATIAVLLREAVENLAKASESNNDDFDALALANINKANTLIKDIVENRTKNRTRKPLSSL